MVEDRLVVFSGLDLEARREFVHVASSVIDHLVATSAGPVTLDCAHVDLVDDVTVGMLVMVARNAQRRGLRVVLERPSVQLRRRLDDDGVSYLFAW